MNAVVSPAVRTTLPGWSIWAGRVASALVVLGMGFSAFLKLTHPPEVADMFLHKFGYPAQLLTPIGILELTCAVVYVVPRTTVLGAVLVTAYLGGAVATHVRVSDAFLVPVVLGVLAWVGLYLREPRLRTLVPLRQAGSDTT